MKYIDELIMNCELAKSAMPDNKFVLNNIADLEGIKSAIYIIEEVGGDVNNTYEALKKYKKLKSRQCPKCPSSEVLVPEGV